MKETLSKLLGHEHLNLDEAERAADAIMGGEATPSQIAGVLVALRMKGETADEVAGFVKSMRRHSVQIRVDDPNAVDSVGTGGDGAGSFNISTAAGLVAAATGVTVAKHGNRSITSKCGAADLLEATGGQIDPGPDKVTESINKVGFGFMFAPRFHPAMRHALPVRRELGTRTVFNILGPMTNPAGVRRLLLGVYDKALMPLMADVLAMTGAERVMLVHSHDGLDEISISAPTDYLEVDGDAKRIGTIIPEDTGLKTLPRGAVAGGDPATNLKILNALLDGEKSAYRDVVVLNAGAVMQVAGQVETVADGVAAASDVIDNGKARKLLNAWVKATRL